mmetsp:Transcript_42635/g.96397  ORF Transcript_42635/g.96397 Transcript_42635/m.96397 type:complete len:190 (-) Transcript_42635:542-1111(-)
MSNGNVQFVDSVICYKELIAKEDAARRDWQTRYGKGWGASAAAWRGLEPFETTGMSNSKMELPAGIPKPALRHPELYRDTVGDEGLTGGTPKRFGGQWDVTARGSTVDTEEKPPRVVKSGPHDCYCDIGYNCWKMAGRARTHNFGLMGTFEREFWTNTPGELAMVWNSKPKASAAEKSMAELDKKVAAR